MIDITIVPKVDHQRQMLTNTHQNLERFQSRLQSEKEFVATYINTDQPLRGKMFGRK